jgi:pimeloyl-ACP methyl ester carboxylesterase
MCGGPFDGSVGAMITRLRMATMLGMAVLLIPLNAASAFTNLTWGPCPGGGGTVNIECAPLKVPLDWEKPQGRQVTLMLGRLKADSPATGTVLVNFGGPGAPGISLMRDFETTITPFPFANLRHSMNVVTWDPRGYPGFGSPALDFSCLKKVPAELGRVPAVPHNPAEFSKLAADNQIIANTCRTQDPELFDHMDTTSNIRDMEAIRRALGESQINFYGGSYGGAYAQMYAAAYPNRVRTMVLDGTGNHSGDFGRELTAQAQDNVVRMRRFTDWCAADASCALHGQDVARTWQQLVVRANKTPIPVVSTNASFDGWVLQQQAASQLLRAAPSDWPALAQHIEKAVHGDASGFADSLAHPFPNVSYPVSECHEWPRFTSYGQLASTSARLTHADPNFGAAGTMVSFLLMCTGWPGAVNNPPQPLPAGVAPLLGVGTWGDFPATNRVVNSVPGSRSIFHNGNGHELYATGNTCVIAHVDRYFTSKTLPAPGATC